MHTSPCLETLLVSPVEEKPEEKGSIEDWVEGAPFTETNSTSPKSWPYQDAHLSLETPLPCRLKLQRECWRLGLPPVPKERASRQGTPSSLVYLPFNLSTCLSCLSHTKVFFILKEKNKPVFLTTFPYDIQTCLYFTSQMLPNPLLIVRTDTNHIYHHPLVAKIICLPSAFTCSPIFWPLLPDSPNSPCLHSCTSDTFSYVSQSLPRLVLASSPMVTPRVSPSPHCALSLVLRILGQDFSLASRFKPPADLQLSCRPTKPAARCLLHSMPLGTSNPTRSQITLLPTSPPVLLQDCPPWQMRNREVGKGEEEWWA